MAEAETRPTAAVVEKLPLAVALFMLFVTGVAYGLSYSLASLAVNDGIPAVAYAFWMGLGAGVVMLLLSFLFGKPLKLSGAHLRGYVVTGVTGFAIPYTVVAWVVANSVPAGIVSMIIALAPMLTYLGAVIFRIEKAWWIKFLGLFVGIGGILLIVLPEASLPSRALVPWILLALVAPLGYAATTISAALLRPPASDSIPFSAGFFLGSAAVLAIVMFAAGQWWWFEGPMGTGDWALVLSVFVQALGIYLFIELVHLMGPVFFTTVNFITPVTGILWGMAIFNERLSAWVLIALVPLFLGVFFVNLQRKAAAPAAGG